MDIRVNEEFVHWGDKPQDWMGFFSPVTKARMIFDNIVVECKYGEYAINPINHEINTLEGIDWYVMSELAKYGMGYKYWEVDPK